MSDGGRISVVTVVKNGCDLLEETILNVIENMAVAEIDYIIIDGGSSDGSTGIISKYSNYLYYWVSEPDAGIYDAMNKGWAAAADKSFIMFLGAGDLIVSLPDSINLYHQNDVIFGTVRMGEKAVFKPRADYHLNMYNSIHHQALLVNKALHPDPPFNCCYRIYADFDFNQRLKKNGAHFIYDPYFIGYATPDGASYRNDFAESLRIIYVNVGLFWSALSVTGYYAMKIFPFLRRFRPF